MWFIINLLVSGLAVALAAYFTPWVSVNGFITAIIVAVVLGLVNATIGAALRFLAIPVNFLTLGLVSAFIGFLMILLTAQLVPGFEISNWMSGLIFAVILGIVNGILWAWSKK